MAFLSGLVYGVCGSGSGCRGATQMSNYELVRGLFTCILAVGCMLCFLLGIIVGRGR